MTSFTDVCFSRFATSAVCLSSDDREFLYRSIVPTDHFQASLPRLPIPKLEDSCRRYLAALTPLLTPEDLRQSERIVSTFRDGEGKSKLNLDKCFTVIVILSH